MRGSRWQSDDLLAAFALYCRTPFGLLHAGNHDIIELAALLDRTPAAVAMKLCNFASLDAAESRRGVKGLSNASRADSELWEEFRESPTAVALASEEALSRIGHSLAEPPEDIEVQLGETETTAERRVRLVQGFFRHAVLTSYEGACAVCGIRVMSLLNASHIIPWSVDVERRGDPTNGLALCTLHDRAFDRGLITLDEELRTFVAAELRSECHLPILIVAFQEVHGRRIHLPHRFAPAADALEYHREHVFGG